MMKRILFILAIVAILMMIAPATAVIDVTVMNRSQSFITWGWSSPGPVNASIDGWTIYFMDPQATSFTLSDLQPNEEHTFRVYSATDSGSNTTSTLPDTSPGNLVLAALNDYGWAVAALILIIVGLRWITIICLLSVFPSLIGLVNSLEPDLGLNFTSIKFWIYVIMLIIGLVFYAIKTARNW